MPKIDVDAAPTLFGTTYPEAYAEPCLSRRRWRLGEAAGLTAFGANLLRLPPNGWSSLRHWHSRDEEFVAVLEGEVVLVEDEGETVLRAGDFAAFKAGVASGHHLVNRSDREAVILEIGTNGEGDVCTYSDADLVAKGDAYETRAGEPVADQPRRYRP